MLIIISRAVSNPSFGSTDLGSLHLILGYGRGSPDRGDGYYSDSGYAHLSTDIDTISRSTTGIDMISNRNNTRCGESLLLLLSSLISSDADESSPVTNHRRRSSLTLLRFRIRVIPVVGWIVVVVDIIGRWWSRRVSLFEIGIILVVVNRRTVTNQRTVTNHWRRCCCRTVTNRRRDHVLFYPKLFFFLHLLPLAFIFYLVY